MKKIMIAFGLAAAIAAPAALADRESETRDIGAFSRLSQLGSMDVYVTVGPDVSLRVEADGDDLSAIMTEIDGDTLTISMQRGNYNWGWNDAPRVYVTVPTLKEASLRGSGDLFIQELKAETFALNLTGSGDVTARDAKLGEIETRLKGSGDIDLSGSCETARLELVGSGDVDAFDLRCESVDVSLKGSGDVNAYAAKAARLDLKGSGDITIKGSPETVQETTKGSGDISVSR